MSRIMKLNSCLNFMTKTTFIYFVADLYYVTWFPLDNPEDIRARDINGDVETEGLGRTVRSVIEGLRQD